jgi:hypothetical protein
MARFKKRASAKPPSFLAPFPSTPPSPPVVKKDAVKDIKQTAEDVWSSCYRDLYTERLRTPISILQAFDRCSEYNSCFPPIQILDWFSHYSNEPQVEIELPPSIHNEDHRWMGLALCASFSVNENSTAIHENLEQETSHYLICCLETAIDSIEPHHVYRPTGEDVQLLYLGGFMWLSYIPRISLPDWLNMGTNITASIFSDSPSLTVQNCGLRLIYPHDEVEFKEAIRHCVASLSDREDLVRQIAVDIHRQRNKKIYDDETIPSRTGSFKRLGGSDDHRLKDKGKRVVE